MNRTAPQSQPRALAPLRDFMRTEAAGGTLLVIATVVALIWANSPLRGAYEALWSTDFSLSLGRYVFGFDLHHWLNDGFMTLFFFIVGLEIKREATSGHLATRKTLALPLFAAIGGMVIPAVTYLLIAGGTEPRGWGVPMATDIALAVGVLSVLGTRVSPSIRAFLLGLAVVDDIGAIVVIAIFYSTGVSATWLLLALASVACTLILKRLDVQWVTAYLVTGLFLWFALYQGGVHPTIAGVVMGLLTPITPKRNLNFEDADEIASDPSVDAHSTVSVVEWFEHILHPYTSFLIVPLFALANAGIELSGESLRNASTSVIAWGVFAGLFVGKPIGIVTAVFIARKSGLAATPEGADSRVFLGVGSAAGIGFTVALFISDLAFTDPTHQADAKLAILVASVASAILSLAILGLRKHNAKESVVAN